MPTQAAIDQINTLGVAFLWLFLALPLSSLLGLSVGILKKQRLLWQFSIAVLAIWGVAGIWMLQLFFTDAYYREDDPTPMYMVLIESYSLVVLVSLRMEYCLDFLQEQSDSLCRVQ